MTSIVPLELSQFGKNPFGKNIWRVVYAPSRTYKAGQKSETGQIRIHELPLYPGHKGWVLERWLPAVKYAGSREAWEAQEQINEIKLGPYPSEGEWCGCDDIFSEIPTQSQVELCIRKILYGSRFSFDEKKRALVAAEEKLQEDWLSRAEDIWHDSQGAFNNKPTNLNPAKRTPDKVKLDQPAPAMPQGDGKFFQN